MPILEYKCCHTGVAIERIVLSAAKAAQAPRVIDCTNPACMAVKPHFARRVDFSQTSAPQFKGDGWTKKGNS